MAIEKLVEVRETINRLHDAEMKMRSEIVKVLFPRIGGGRIEYLTVGDFDLEAEHQVTTDIVKLRIS